MAENKRPWQGIRPLVHVGWFVEGGRSALSCTFSLMRCRCFADYTLNAMSDGKGNHYKVIQSHPGINFDSEEDIVPVKFPIGFWTADFKHHFAHVGCRHFGTSSEIQVGAKYNQTLNQTFLGNYK